MPIDKSRDDLAQWISKKLAITEGRPTEGRFLIYGPAPSLRRRGESRRRVDWDAATGTEEKTAELVGEVFAFLQKLSEEPEKGKLFVLCFVQGQEGYDDYWTCEPLPTSGEAPQSYLPDTDSGHAYVAQAAANAIGANTQMATTLITKWAESMDSLVGFAHTIGEMKGEMQASAQAQMLRAQAEMAEKVLPHLSNAIDKVVLAVRSWNGSGDEGEDIPDQPEELGEERLLWNIAMFEHLGADIQAHAMKKPGAFTKDVKKKLRSFIEQAQASLSLLDQLGEA